ncbi:hypothetical protein K504DRAFT_501150 [Pleomassaria siparia CBS 279.74]|uniref:Uncharacterized protein n=1 Tax=Pleomassaria siparia CBS 279.74 TaxID=1314801 RepID=A0A6G1KEI1_9PLEO|nr:hypothetical protein K504DRAFT_501150 [Pleomassaria siparia CBS 279.74]
MVSLYSSRGYRKKGHVVGLKFYSYPSTRAGALMSAFWLTCSSRAGGIQSQDAVCTIWNLLKRVASSWIFKLFEICFGGTESTDSEFLGRKGAGYNPERRD